MQVSLLLPVNVKSARQALVVQVQGSEAGIRLVEKIIEKDSRYNNKLLSEISKKHNEIIIMIQRNGQVIIPNGNVRLTTGDILVINRAVN